MFIFSNTPEKLEIFIIQLKMEKEIQILKKQQEKDKEENTFYQCERNNEKA